MKGNYFFRNNQLQGCELWENETQQGVVVYEVLRIVEGIPLFFDDHFQRLINSCRLIGQEYKPDRKELFRQIVELAKKNDFETGNITLKIIFNPSVSQSFNSSVFIYFIPHSYPTEHDYRNGVKVGFLEIERNNPEAKVEQGMKEKVNQSGQEDDVYEVMLVDKDGYITEGSRSNMVFVKGDTLYTCPLNRVLKGITLAKVLEIALAENIPVVFEAVHRAEISSYDALFITGTSPKILPVVKAGEISFNVRNLILQSLMLSYGLLVEKEIRNKTLNID